MNITNEDLQVLALQIGNLQMQVVVLEREKRELTAHLQQLAAASNPDGLHIDGLTERGAASQT